MLRSDGYGASGLEATRIGRRPGRLARAAGRTRKARLTLKGPALWGAAAAAILLIMGGSYLAMTSQSPGTSVASLSSEQLEQALAERRKADTLAAEKRRLEFDARQKAQAEAEAKRQADAELDQARQARLKAEQELAELRARLEARRQESTPRDQEALTAQRAVEEAAQRKAEEEAAALREAEEEAEKKAAIEAEAKRQADQALATAEAQRKLAEAEAKAKAAVEATARSQASEEAQRKAEQDATARRQTDDTAAKAQAEREKVEADAKIKADAKAEADKVVATLAKLKEEGEAAERTLRLEQPERQRLQVALTSLGFDTRGTDGMFGPRSREMVGAWQKKANAPATGFLTATQRDQLLRSAAPAVTRWNEEQKKIEDDKKKADETQAAATPNQSGTGAPASPASGLSGPGAASAGSSRAAALQDGTYGGGLGIYGKPLSLELRMSNGRGTGAATSSTCGTVPVSLSVDASGNVTGEMKVTPPVSTCSWVPAQITGRAEGGKLLLVIQGATISGTSRGQATLVLGGASQAAATGPPALPTPDGLWRGTYTCGPSTEIHRAQGFTLILEMRLTGGSGVWRSSANLDNGNTFEIRVSIDGTAVKLERFQAMGAGSFGHSGLSTPLKVSGRYDANTIRAEGKESTAGNRQCELSLNRSQ
jgi:peptidoglycan hydrolase-like protein with peptidoglycan-binding domain